MEGKLTKRKEKKKPFLILPQLTYFHSKIQFIQIYFETRQIKNQTILNQIHPKLT